MPKPSQYCLTSLAPSRSDYAPWVGDFIEECAAFPNGAYNDQVDAMTQALLRWNSPIVQATVYYEEPYHISP